MKILKTLLSWVLPLVILGAAIGGERGRSPLGSNA